MVRAITLLAIAAILIGIGYVIMPLVGTVLAQRDMNASLSTGHVSDPREVAVVYMKYIWLFVGGTALGIVGLVFGAFGIVKLIQAKPKGITVPNNLLE